MAKKNSYGGGIAGAMARAQERRDRKKAEMNTSDNTDSLGKRRRRRRKIKDNQDTSSTFETSRITKRIRKSVSKLTEKIPNIQGKVLSSFNTFGKPEDNIELNVYDNVNTLVAHIRDFKDYTFTEEGKTPDGLLNEIIVDPVTSLKKLNFNNGQFTLEYRFQRKKIVNTFKKVFFIKEISNSRREIRIDNNELNNLQLQERYNIFKNELDDSLAFKDFTLNFGNGINITAVNIFLDKSGDNNSLLIKLLDPLPLTIANTFTLRIVEDLIEPAKIDINLESPLIEDDIIPIAGPNFKIDTRLNSSTPSEFKSYDELLGGGITSSYENMLNALSGSSEPNIEYTNLTTDSGYHFENFTHFSSATERLNNFKYKLKLIELYDSQISNVNTIVGNASSSVTVLSSKKVIETKKKKLIGGFDGYERFLYYESGAYSWPKSNLTKPYIQYAISTSQALTWFGSNDGANDYYGGQIYSASQFDAQNIYNLNKLIPEYIKNDSNNDQYKLFVDMIGQHFDQSWLYIKSLTENKRAENKLNRGIDKDLVYNALKGLGIQVFDEFENEDLFGYLTGINKNGSLLHQTGSGITLVTASNDGSLSKADITKEKWKRIYHNLPYLLKTKGTERGIRALITSYGIPSTILNVKEFGGSTTDKTTYKTFTHDKFSYALEGDSGTNGFFIKTKWSSSAAYPLSSSAKTVEFQIKPHKSSESYHLFSLSGSDVTGLSVSDPLQTTDQHLILQPYTGSDISTLGDSAQYGRLVWFANNGGLKGYTSHFPVYNGEFWNIFIGVDKADVADFGGTDRLPVKFGAYQANHLKTVNSYLHDPTQQLFVLGIQSYTPQTLTQIGRTWGLFDAGGPSAPDDFHQGGAANAYIGGLPASSNNHDDVDGLRYSGSLREIRYHFKELLSHDTLTKHALVPSMYSGNTISSSYDSLVLRLPLGGNLKQNSQSYHPNINADILCTNFSSNLITNSDFSQTDVSTNSGLLGWITSSGVSASVNIIGETINIFSKNDADSVADNAAIITNNYPLELGRRYELTFDVVEPPTGSLYLYSAEKIEDTNSSALITPTTGSYSFNFVAYRGSGRLQLNRNGHTNNTCSITLDNVEVRQIPYINSNLVSSRFISSTETHHLTTPDTVGKSMTSEKVRLDSGEVEDNILSYDVKTETSVLDRQPTDSNDLGVYFSPSYEINKDIIYQLGSFRLDDYIGDPTHISENNYPDLKDLSNEYFKKPIDRFKYTDFIDITKQFDHTLFKMIENMVPAKANLKTGILIEPHYLERSKFGNPSTLPGVEKHNNYEANYDIRYTSETSDFNLSGQNLLTEVTYDISPESQYVSFDTGSNPLLNNAINGRTSKAYFRSITSNTEEF